LSFQSIKGAQQNLCAENCVFAVIKLIFLGSLHTWRARDGPSSQKDLKIPASADPDKGEQPTLPGRSRFLAQYFRQQGIVDRVRLKRDTCAINRG